MADPREEGRRACRDKYGHDLPSWPQAMCVEKDLAHLNPFGRLTLNALLWRKGLIAEAWALYRERQKKEADQELQRQNEQTQKLRNLVRPAQSRRLLDWLV